jgi:hypothetical protein
MNRENAKVCDGGGGMMITVWQVDSLAYISACPPHSRGHGNLNFYINPLYVGKKNNINLGLVIPPSWLRDPVHFRSFPGTEPSVVHPPPRLLGSGGISFFYPSGHNKTWPTRHLPSYACSTTQWHPGAAFGVPGASVRWGWMGMRRNSFPLGSSACGES